MRSLIHTGLEYSIIFASIKSTLPTMNRPTLTRRNFSACRVRPESTSSCADGFQSWESGYPGNSIFESFCEILSSRCRLELQLVSAQLVEFVLPVVSTQSASQWIQQPC